MEPVHFPRIFLKFLNFSGLNSHESIWTHLIKAAFSQACTCIVSCQDRYRGDQPEDRGRGSGRGSSDPTHSLCLSCCLALGPAQWHGRGLVRGVSRAARSQGIIRTNPVIATQISSNGLSPSPRHLKGGLFAPISYRYFSLKYTTHDIFTSTTVATCQTNRSIPYRPIFILKMKNVLFPKAAHEGGAAPGYPGPGGAKGGHRDFFL